MDGEERQQLDRELRRPTVDFRVPDQITKSRSRMLLEYVIAAVSRVLNWKVAVPAKAPENAVISVKKGDILITKPGFSLMLIKNVDGRVVTYVKGRILEGKIVLWKEYKEDTILVEQITNLHYELVGFDKEIKWARVEELRASGK